MAKFVVVPKEENYVTMTIRIEKDVQEQYSQLAAETHRSRNELIGMALRFALEHMEIQTKD